MLGRLAMKFCPPWHPTLSVDWRVEHASSVQLRLAEMLLGAASPQGCRDCVMVNSEQLQAPALQHGPSVVD